MHAVLSAIAVAMSVLALPDAADQQLPPPGALRHATARGRYLAARSDRVMSMAYIGIPFGPAADPMFKAIIQKRLDEGTSPPVVAAWTGALLDYPPVEPADLKCPTLWMVGTRTSSAMESATRVHPLASR